MKPNIFLWSLGLFIIFCVGIVFFLKWMFNYKTIKQTYTEYMLFLKEIDNKDKRRGLN